MAGAHHTGFLLAILIGILLLLLVTCVLCICYCREKCFQLERSQRKSRRLDGVTREQATSMTSVSRNFLDPPTLSFYELRHCQQFSCPLTESVVSQQGDHETSCTILEMWASRQNEQGDLSQEARHSSELPTVARNKCDGASPNSVSYCAFSSCPPCMDSALKKSQAMECSLVDRSASRRRSSSMNSQVGSDLLLAPQESTIQDASSFTDHRRVTSQQGHCTDLSETPSHQHFSWHSLTVTSSTSSRNSLLTRSHHRGLVDLSNRSRHAESVSVPGTLKRPSLTAMDLEGKSLMGQSLVQLPKTNCLLRPKAWFISLGKNPLPDQTGIGNEDPNNVSSLDSGVDILELQIRGGSRPTEDGVKEPARQQEPVEGLGSREHQSRCGSDTEQLHSTGPRESPHMEDNTGSEQHAACAEGEVKVNQVHYGNKRSLWQKREERPLFGIN